MRPSAIVPILLCTASLVLTFLCLFAGNDKGFMEDYAILTLNTSRIGQNVLKDLTSPGNGLSSEISSILHIVPESLESDVENAITSLAKELGLHDFYSVHIMDYCEGYYTPSPLPNRTLTKSEIRKNVTSCSNQTAMYNFDPAEILQQELNNSGHGYIDLERNLDWPKDITNGIRALRLAARATFVLYCISLGLVGVALILACISFFLDGRLSALVNVVVDWLAFVVVGIASAIASAVGVKGTEVINEHGEKIGISADHGSKFLVITWVATGLMLVASMVWCADCIVGRKRRTTPKHD
ncbi:hypothetical protein MYCFIDRAFT_85950 [Lecanosticta acicola]|uniref:Integral membrane protein-like protein n=1 Tax=Lecanosticta acicola TaxID=111012 RepID=A0AAI9ECC3_9PEZI|nr:hypothetical protein MYCFIDRAFT_85950 [Lecanosticta acicola]